MTDRIKLAEELERPEEPWFCDQGGFWGTPKQIILCAKCGKNERKRPDEPRHYANLFQPTLHVLCDECFDGLQDASAALKAERVG